MKTLLISWCDCCHKASLFVYLHASCQQGKPLWAVKNDPYRKPSSICHCSHRKRWYYRDSKTWNDGTKTNVFCNRWLLNCILLQRSELKKHCACSETWWWECPICGTLWVVLVRCHEFTDCFHTVLFFNRTCYHYSVAGCHTLFKHASDP